MTYRRARTIWLVVDWHFWDFAKLFVILCTYFFMHSIITDSIREFSSNPMRLPYINYTCVLSSECIFTGTHILIFYRYKLRVQSAICCTMCVHMLWSSAFFFRTTFDSWSFTYSCESVDSSLITSRVLLWRQKTRTGVVHQSMTAGTRYLPSGQHRVRRALHVWADAGVLPVSDPLPNRQNSIFLNTSITIRLTSATAEVFEVATCF